MMWYRPQAFVLGGSGKAQLRVRGLSAGYGPFEVIRQLNFDVMPGLTVILGPNGAGKTTLLRALSGQIPMRGEVLLDGEDLPEKAHEIVKAGVALVPEGRQLFPQMTVLENLELGGWLQKPNVRQERMEMVLNDFPKLRERATQLAGTMSGGEQQMLAMARALMSRPRVLLLDEPSMGLSPIMVDKIFEVVRDVSARGVTVLLVEQNARLALMAANRGYVMDSGLITMSGDAKEMLSDPRVRAAYLGE